MSSSSTAISLGEHQLPKPLTGRRHWGNLSGGAGSLAIAQSLSKFQEFGLVVAEDSHTAEKIFNELRFFLPEQFPVLLFPDWETLIYDSF